MKEMNLEGIEAKMDKLGEGNLQSTFYDVIA
ncbi:hypothetical protein VT96_0212910 [Clostridium sporogenes]|nr:hypothetical protein T258_3381 [Clostridium botulinum Prevot_594]KRU41569.1 hypothetical protein VT94_20340 [Clostridium sporogenes]OQP94241.1 hypothetical protein VT93_0223120 [Clostridium sporogenes]OQP98517.1 hypothetical protein VT96_0212910 [Clostridium sporogenes]SQB32193.1 Uncharacterised protein [Clostridium sporogenes]